MAGNRKFALVLSVFCIVCPLILWGQMLVSSAENETRAGQASAGSSFQQGRDSTDPLPVSDFDQPGWIRVVFDLPSVPLTDYPITVEFQTYPASASCELAILASDSLTNLYWWPDSIAGQYSRIHVIGDWDTSPDTIYIMRQELPAYMNADSVFLFYDEFNQNFSLSQPITDWDNYNAVVFDTNGTMIARNPLGADSIIRESSGIIYDWQESSAERKWKFYYCGERRALDNNPVTRYLDNILMWAYAPHWTSNWTKVDTVRYDSSGYVRAIHAEDPDITWLPQLSKWAIYCEQHNTSAQYHMGLYLADSLDQPAWQFYGNIPALESQVGGTPFHWLDKEQASPSIVWTPNRDTLLMFFEGFMSSGDSYMGLALSYNDTAEGDILGLDWHLTDSTGAVNEANPMPIVPWRLTGQADSIKTIPDAAMYLNGEYAVFSHGANKTFWYKGNSPRDLVYRGTSDSTHLFEVITFDTVGGNFISPYVEDISGNVIRGVLRDFDSTRWSNPKWTVHHRAARPNSRNRFLCSETISQNGLLTMYPPQRQTGVVAIQSIAQFTGGVAIDIWMQVSQWDTEALAVISLGSTVLQDHTGSQVQNAAWYNPQVSTGYSLRIHPTSTRWYKNANGAATAGRGSIGTVDPAVIGSMRRWTFHYTADDSLKVFVDGQLTCAARDVTYHGVPYNITIAQGERGEYDRGGVMRIAKLQVTRLVEQDVYVANDDTLYTLDSTFCQTPQNVSIGFTGSLNPGDAPMELKLRWLSVPGATRYGVFGTDDNGDENIVTFSNFIAATEDTTIALANPAFSNTDALWTYRVVAYCPSGFACETIPGQFFRNSP